MASDELLVVVVIFAVFGALFWYLLHRQNMLAKARMQRAESINRLIDKFATAKEVTDFLESEQGRRFLEEPGSPVPNPFIRVLRFVQTGVVFLFLGAGFFLNAFLLRGETDINFIRKVMDLQYWGMFSLVFGAGLLFVAVLTSVLVKRWGLNADERNVQL